MKKINKTNEVFDYNFKDYTFSAICFEKKNVSGICEKQ